jgi:ADP-ribosylglycohydrolase
MDSFTVADIERVLRGYAAGDAFGVAYEFAETFSEVDPNLLVEKIGWPYGGVSDDTLLTLLSIQALRENTPEQARVKFLESMRAAVPQLRGLGPTTRAALGLPVKDAERHQVGTSNGALMRCSLLGLAFKEEEKHVRREFIRQIASATHKTPKAIAAALIGSALFADARANGEKNSIFEVALREAGQVDIEIAIDDWREPICTGVSNDSVETLNAVLWTAKLSTDAREALKIACELGGDTDTVAALSIALIIARKREDADFDSIPWLGDIDWEEISQLNTCAGIVQEIYLKEKSQV